jgi:LysM repeat protein
VRTNRILPVIFALSLLLLIGVAPLLAQETTHTILPGENLYRIAVRYGVDVDSLAAANNIANTWNIYAGQTLVIPDNSAPVAQPETVADAGIVDVGIDETLIDQPAVELAEAVEEVEVAAPEVEPAYHTVGRGETLASIARTYGLTAESLADMNDITNPDLIYAGQELIVSGETAVGISVADSGGGAALAETSHIVAPGEHLAQIADIYEISWLAIAQANNIFDPNLVQAGDVLVIPGLQTDAVTGETIAASDMGIVNIPAAPAALVAEGRSIIVDITDSRIYAYENGRLVRNVLVSTGLPATPTVQGEFSVDRKYAAQTMSGPGYYLPDVPYVMYFYGAYAIHGAYWHDNWGVPMSHGCVNLPPDEAEWFFNFAPEGTSVRVQT